MGMVSCFRAMFKYVQPEPSGYYYYHNLRCGSRLSVCLSVSSFLSCIIVVVVVAVADVEVATLGSNDLKIRAT